MIMAPVLTLGSRKAGSGVDPDAAAYFATAGVTDAAAKADLNAFILGVKAQGLWAGGRFHTFRAAQNAGSGTTVFGFGGMNSIDGTLSGTSGWGANGVNCALGLVIFGSIGAPFGGGIFTGSVHAPFAAADSHRGVTFLSTGNTRAGMWAGLSDGNFYFDAMGINQTSDRVVGVSGSADNTFAAWLGTAGPGSGVTSFKNGNNVIGSGGTFDGGDLTYDSVWFGSNSGGADMPGIVAFQWWSTAGSLTGAQVGDFYNLYKTTLGKGLSLP